MRLENWNLIGANVLVEGAIYDIRNFHTIQAAGNLRPVSSPISIRFSVHTIIHQIEDEDWSIPKYKFEFVDLLDLENYVESNITDEPPPTTIGNYNIPTI